MSEEPEEPLPKIPLERDEARMVAVLGAMVLGLWAGGTYLAHWMWDINWIVAVLLVPAAVAPVYGVLKLLSRRKK